MIAYLFLVGVLFLYFDLRADTNWEKFWPRDIRPSNEVKLESVVAYSTCFPLRKCCVDGIETFT